MANTSPGTKRFPPLRLSHPQVLAAMRPPHGTAQIRQTNMLNRKFRGRNMRDHQLIVLQNRLVSDITPEVLGYYLIANLMNAFSEASVIVNCPNQSVFVLQ